MEKKVNFRISELLITYKKVVFIGLLIVIITETLNLVNPWIMKVMIDKAIPQHDLQLLIICVCAIIFIPLITTALSSIETYYYHDVGTEVELNIRQQLVSKITRLSPKTMHQFKQGDLSGRILRGTHEIGFYLRFFFFSAPSYFLRSVGITCFIFLLDWKLALISFLLLPIVLWAAYGWAYKYKKLSDEIGDVERDYSSHVTEFIAGMKTIQMFHKEEYEKTYNQRLNDQFQQLMRRSFTYSSFFSSLFSSLTNSLSLGVLYAFGIWLIWNRQLTIGDLIAFTVYIPQLFGAADRIQDLYFHSIRVKPEVKQCEEIMNLPEENVDSPQALPLPTTQGKIEFDHVSFHYQEDQQNLLDISFVIEPGEFIGIVGPTGGGKTTILDLIMRFYQPTNGEIRLDNRNIKDYRLVDFREQIGMVSQDIFLWNRSIRDNLVYVAPDASESEMIEATKLAQIYAFIEKLPEGFETIIGDRGLRLSGGERQRLSIARTILKKPNILLLDEPTSALDAKTETVLQQYLEEFYREKTVIVVAHRLATIQKADRILVVDSGKIVEQGTHPSLMEQQGIYYQLFTEQMGRDEKEMYLA